MALSDDLNRVHRFLCNCTFAPFKTQYLLKMKTTIYRRFREEVKQAHGIILGTPEYHGGYNGRLTVWPKSAA